MSIPIHSAELDEETNIRLEAIRKTTNTELEFRTIVLVVEAAYIKGRIYQADKGVLG